MTGRPCCASRSAVQKGFDVLLEAFARHGPAAAGVDLLFVGEGPQRSLLEAAGARLGLEQRVRFLGPLTPEVTATLYRTALPPGDAGALAGALDTLLSDPGMRQRLGERGRALAVERFSWPALAAATSPC
jgi:glycosyltransferase involved in cell wall biosynthesis